jgi:hypothetical protein
MPQRSPSSRSPGSRSAARRRPGADVRPRRRLRPDRDRRRTDRHRGAGPGPHPRRPRLLHPPQRSPCPTIAQPERPEDHAVTAPGSPCPTQPARLRPLPNYPSRTNAVAGVHASSWTGLHPKLGCRGRWADNDLPPIVAGTVIRVDVEHTFRFVKSTLSWTTTGAADPRPSQPLDLAGRGRVHPTAMARGLVDDQRLPWEPPRDPAKLTPARDRRGFRRLRPTLGTPASAPKSDNPGPGRPKNTRRPPRTRYSAVKKAA